MERFLLGKIEEFSLLNYNVCCFKDSYSMDLAGLDSDSEYEVGTGCSSNIGFFPQNVVIFLNSASSAAAPMFDLPLWKIYKNLRKNTIFN